MALTPAPKKGFVSPFSRGGAAGPLVVSQAAKSTFAQICSEVNMKNADDYRNVVAAVTSESLKKTTDENTSRDKSITVRANIEQVRGSWQGKPTHKVAHTIINLDDADFEKGSYVYVPTENIRIGFMDKKVQQFLNPYGGISAEARDCHANMVYQILYHAIKERELDIKNKVDDAAMCRVPEIFKGSPEYASQPAYVKKYITVGNAPTGMNPPGATPIPCKSRPEFVEGEAFKKKIRGDQSAMTEAIMLYYDQARLKAYKRMPICISTTYPELVSEWSTTIDKIFLDDGIPADVLQKDRIRTLVHKSLQNVNPNYPSSKMPDQTVRTNLPPEKDGEAISEIAFIFHLMPSSPFTKEGKFSEKSTWSYAALGYWQCVGKFYRLINLFDEAGLLEEKISTFDHTTDPDSVATGKPVHMFVVPDRIQLLSDSVGQYQLERAHQIASQSNLPEYQARVSQSVLLWQIVGSVAKDGKSLSMKNNTVPNPVSEDAKIRRGYLSKTYQAEIFDDAAAAAAAAGGAPTGPSSGSEAAGNPVDGADSSAPAASPAVPAAPSAGDSAPAVPALAPAAAAAAAAPAPNSTNAQPQAATGSAPAESKGAEKVIAYKNYIIGTKVDGPLLVDWTSKNEDGTLTPYIDVNLNVRQFYGNFLMKPEHLAKFGFAETDHKASPFFHYFAAGSIHCVIGNRSRDEKHSKDSIIYCNLYAPESDRAANGAGLAQAMEALLGKFAVPSTSIPERANDKTGWESCGILTIVDTPESRAVLSAYVQYTLHYRNVYEKDVVCISPGKDLIDIKQTIRSIGYEIEYETAVYLESKMTAENHRFGFPSGECTGSRDVVLVNGKVPANSVEKVSYVKGIAVPAQYEYYIVYPDLMVEESCKKKYGDMDPAALKHIICDAYIAHIRSGGKVRDYLVKNGLSPDLNIAENKLDVTAFNRPFMLYVVRKTSEETKKSAFAARVANSHIGRWSGKIRPRVAKKFEVKSASEAAGDSVSVTASGAASADAMEVDGPAPDPAAHSNADESAKEPAAPVLIEDLEGDDEIAGGTKRSAPDAEEETHADADTFAVPAPKRRKTVEPQIEESQSEYPSFDAAESDQRSGIGAETDAWGSDLI